MALGSVAVASTAFTHRGAQAAFATPVPSTVLELLPTSKQVNDPPRLQR
jgi:hypothetical protein